MTVLVQKLGANVVDFVVSQSHVSNAFSKRNSSYWIVRVLTLPDFGYRWLSQLNQLPDTENLCGHDTGGFREQFS